MGELRRRGASRGRMVALALSLVCAASPALAQPSKAAVEQARIRYERGISLYEEGNYDGALIELQRAYETAPSYKILFNIGQVHRQLNDYVSALRAYERYLSEGAKEVPAARRSEVEREIQQLRARVASIEVTTSVPDAEITVDDAPYGRTPLAQPLLVNPGRRKITAVKAGRNSATRTVTVAGSDSIKVDLDLPPAGAGAPPPAATTTGAPPPPPPAPAEKQVPWIGWTLTGVFAVSATVTGIMALSASSSLKDDRNAPGATRDNLDSGHSKTKNLALVSDILWGATAVAGGVSLYYTLRTPPSREGARATSGATVGVGLGPGSVDLRGSF